MSSQPQEGHGRHPTFKQYVVVALILFAITAIEFVIIYPEYRLGPATVPTLIILSIVKFAIVIFFYMHLKFDPKLLTWIFLGGLALGTVVTFALLFLFSSTSSTPQQRAFAAERAVPFEHGAEVRKPPSETPPDTPEQTKPDLPPPDGGLVAMGKELFTGAGGCNACHAIEGISAGALGPDLTHIGTVASSRVSGVSAEDYLDESIRDPAAFVVPEYMDGLMPKDFSARLEDSQIDALVQFLMAQQ